MQKLSRNEMKNLKGGGSMVCTCNNSGSTPDAVICSFNSLSGWANCLNGSQNHCSTTYGGGTTCSFSAQL